MATNNHEWQNYVISPSASTDPNVPCWSVDENTWAVTTTGTATSSVSPQIYQSVTTPITFPKIPPVEERVQQEVRVPLYADAATVKASLKVQLEVLQSLEEGLSGKHAEAISDAIFYIQETLESLEKI